MRKLKKCLLLFLLLCLLYAALRFVFYLLYFRDSETPAPLPGLFYWGFRLDFTILFYLHIPFLCFYFFVYDVLAPALRRRIIMALLLLVNIPLLIINFIDLVYYRFNLRRSNYDLLGVWWDSLAATSTFWKLFSGYFIAFVAVSALLWWLLLKLFAREQERMHSYKQLFRHSWLPGILFILLGAVLARGLAARPIMPATPLLYFPPEYQSLVTNSGFTFSYSLWKHQQPLREKHYFPSSKADSVFSIRRQYTSVETLQRKNVVIFILESFCREYFEEGPYRARMPFLDSVIAHSTWCSNAWANGSTSNQGIVSILGSMPPFLDEPYYHSIFSNNKIYGIGSLLKDQGYSTHFFMGAGPDHFGFGKYCKLLGIDQYHSGNDFGDNRYHDGVWGIYDHRFMPYAGQVLAKERQPFFSVLFNLSSHPPFSVSPELKQQFDLPGQEAFQQSAAYVDYSLRLFFDTIRNTDWFSNTLFVFVADHSVISYLRAKNDGMAIFRIPLFIYDAANPVYREVKEPVQQLDIVPTILQRLHYQGPFLSFGRSVDDSVRGCILNKHFGIYSVSDGTYILGYNESTEQAVYLYNELEDAAMKNNLLNDSRYSTTRDKLLAYCRAVLLTFNNSLIENRLYIK